MTDRLYIAEQVERRIRYLNQDATDLEYALRGETLSEGAREDLTRVIERLQRIAAKAKPARLENAA